MFVLADQVELDSFGRGGNALLISIHKLDVDTPEFVVLILKNGDLVFVHPVGPFPAVT